jgi:hypothetical protein
MDTLDAGETKTHALTMIIATNEEQVLPQGN